MIKTKIDLSKIPAKELPRKKVTVDFGDGEAEYWIRALGDADRMCIQVLYGTDNVFRPKDLYVLLLSCGLEVIKGDQDIARLLVERATIPAQTVGNEIYSLTNDFYDSKDQEAEQAEKNSQETAANTEAQEVNQA